MLSISHPIKTGGAEEYYLSLTQEDYYSNAHEEQGHWYGRGTKALGLCGKVNGAEFHNLLTGYTADGRSALVQNAGDKDRDRGWDLTLSAPKSVSLLWALSDENVRCEIEQAHKEATRQALDYIEEVAITRRGPAGRIREKAHLVFAMFEHRVSREHDPQIHTHAVLINATVRKDGTTGAVHSVECFRHKKDCGAVYQEHLAAQLHKRLGVVTEAESVGFHILGVPKDLCVVFSKRRQAIEQAMREQGTEGAVAAKVAALATRPKKEDRSREVLTAQWIKTAETYGWGPAQARELVESAQRSMQAHRPRTAEQTTEATLQNQVQTPASSLTPPSPVAAQKTNREAALRSVPPRNEQQSREPQGTSPGSSVSRTNTAKPARQVQTPAHPQRAATRTPTSRPAVAKTPLKDRTPEAPNRLAPRRSAAQRHKQKERAGLVASESVSPRDWSSLIFHAPRSVSTFWAVAPEQVRRAVERAHDHAVKVACLHVRHLAENQQHAARQQPKNRSVRVLATFQMLTTPTFAPDLRSQVILENTGRSKGFLGATLERFDVHRHRATVQAVYKSEFAFQLRRTLQIALEPSNKTFQIRGAPARLGLSLSSGPKDGSTTLVGKKSLTPELSDVIKDGLNQARKDRANRGAILAEWSRLGHKRGWGSQDAAKLVGAEPSRAVTQKQFDQTLKDESKRLMMTSRTRSHVVRHAASIAVRCGVGADVMWKGLEKLSREQVVRIVWKQLVPKAPAWSPLRHLKLPVIQLGERSRRWGRIHHRLKIFKKLEFRVQEDHPFRHAPKWNPLHKLKISALRFVAKPAKVRHSKNAEIQQQSHLY